MKGQNGNNVFLDELEHFFDDITFFIFSDEDVETYIKRLHVLESRKYRKDSKSLSLQSKLLAQRFYGYLATLSQIPEAKEGKDIDLEKECDTDWFRRSIGLTNEQADQDIVSHLLTQFDEWLSEKGSITVPWGSIQYSSSKKVILTNT